MPPHRWDRCRPEPAVALPLNWPAQTGRADDGDEELAAAAVPRTGRRGRWPTRWVWRLISTSGTSRTPAGTAPSAVAELLDLRHRGHQMHDGSPVRGPQHMGDVAGEADEVARAE